MISAFTNSIILPENLPTLKEADFNPVDRKYIIILIFNNLLTTLFLLALVWGFYLAMNGKIGLSVPVISTGGVLLIMILSLASTLWAFRYRGYLIRELDIAYQRGWLRYRLTSIPLNRIQHVELIQGLLAKRMKLASVKIYTAGSSGDDLVIPGLPLETARHIREFLTGKISQDE